MELKKERIEALIEALPYFQKHRGSLFVIKVGGHAMTSKESLEKIMQDVVLMQYIGIRPVVIHGGGPEISHMMSRMGKKPEFVEGLRVTDSETLEIVQMVLIGSIGQKIVSIIDRFGGLGLTLSGRDGRLIIAKKRSPIMVVDREVDLGMVGEITEINPNIIKVATENGFIPVISPLALDDKGTGLNINADTVAGEIAAALDAEKLIMISDVDGLFEDPSDPKTLISKLTIAKIETLLKDGKIGEGMIPKVEAIVHAISSGVSKAHIINGKVAHSLLIEIFTKEGIGTMLTGD